MLCWIWRRRRLNRLLDIADQAPSVARVTHAACCSNNPDTLCVPPHLVIAAASPDGHFDVPTLLGHLSEQQLVLLETMVTFVDRVQRLEEPDTSTYSARPRLSSEALPVATRLHPHPDEVVDPVLVNDELPHEVDITHWPLEEVTATSPWHSALH